MQRQLGITAMRPGPSGNPSAPNAANSDEAKANPFTDIPDILVTKGGARVTTAAAWHAAEAELLEDFSREVYGRVPRDVPRVTWREVRRVSMTVAGQHGARTRAGRPRRQPARAGDHRRHHADARHTSRGDQGRSRS